MVVGNSCSQQPAQPTSHGLHVTQVVRAPQRPQRKLLHDVLGLIGISESAEEEAEDAVMSVDQSCFHHGTLRTDLVLPSLIPMVTRNRYIGRVCHGGLS